MSDRVARLAGAGLAALGVASGERVGMLALNSERYLEYYHAVAWAGAVRFPATCAGRRRSIVYGLRDTRTSLLLVDDAFERPGTQLAVELPMPLVFMGDGEAPDGQARLRGADREHDPVDDRTGRGDDLRGIFYTGGTTGHPKGVMLSHRGLAVNGMTCIAVNGYGQATRYLHAAPMFHMADMAATVSVTQAGGSHALHPDVRSVGCRNRLCRAGPISRCSCPPCSLCSTNISSSIPLTCRGSIRSPMAPPRSPQRCHAARRCSMGVADASSIPTLGRPVGEPAPD